MIGDFKGFQNMCDKWKVSVKQQLKLQSVALRCGSLHFRNTVKGVKLASPEGNHRSADLDLINMGNKVKAFISSGGVC